MQYEYHINSVILANNLIKYMKFCFAKAYPTLKHGTFNYDICDITGDLTITFDIQIRFKLKVISVIVKIRNLTVIENNGNIDVSYLLDIVVGKKHIRTQQHNLSCIGEDSIEECTIYEWMGNDICLYIVDLYKGNRINNPKLQYIS